MAELIQHETRHGMLHTVAYDEEGDEVFVLPFRIEKPEAVYVVTLLRATFKRGVEVGRESLAQDLRKLLGAAETDR